MTTATSNNLETLRATLDRVLAYLALTPIGEYALRGELAAEPTAWSAIALAQAKKHEQAATAADWLAQLQQRDGSVGVTLSQKQPAWSTSLAILAWQAVDADRYRDNTQRGVDWAFAQSPWTQPPHENFGHDPSLAGWSWAANTHCWLEPTAFFARALRAAGQADHPRARQAIAMLVDRLLPSGGANYGNTIVLGQELLEHLQPTGIAAWALADAMVEDPRLGRTLDYLARATAEPTGVASLAYGVLGLAAHGRDVQLLATTVCEAWQRAQTAGGVYKPALVALAADAILRQAERS